MTTFLSTRRLQLWLFLLLIPFSAFPAGKFDLSLKTGTYILPENLEVFIANPFGDEVAFNGKYFRLIQFYDIPTPTQKNLLEASGIHISSFLSSYTYSAIINQSADLSKLRLCNVRAVVVFKKEWKLNRQLTYGDYPSWAVQSTKFINLYLRYFKGQNSEAVINDLVSKGYEIKRQYEYSDWVEIKTEISNILNTAALPYVSGLEPIAPPSTPDDEKARSLHRSNVINSYSPMGRHYDGTGVSVALGDDGPVGPHIDYQGRIDQSNTTANNGNHGDMTTGILMGGGNLNPTIRGMGTGAFIYIYDIGPYSHVLNSPVTNQTLGVMVTSTSYSQGCNDYSTDTQTGDQILNQNPTLLHVYSAGNNGPGDCGYGAGAGWGNITGGYKQGKNVIACGNLSYLDVLEASSSRGPSEDGRIKPDICANGIGQLSTDGPNAYQVGGGTSAACPGVAGIVTQLHQAFRDLNGGQNAEGALIKACLLNTADELGNPGPDFQYGWGRVNAFRAVTTMEDNRYQSDTISQGGNNIHTITVPAGTSQLRVMCYWSDVEGDPLAIKALVNDINMNVVDPSANSYNPWVLNPAPDPITLNDNAIRAIDNLNNMEQVTIDSPIAGTYTINVNGFVIPQGVQKYYIVYEFLNDNVNVTYPIGYEGFVPGETETIRWDAFGNSTPFSLEYSTDLGTSWNNIAAAVPASQRYYNWTVPNTVTSQALIRVTRNALPAQNPEPFNIVGLPINVVVTYACPDSIRLTWNAVPGAFGYEVSMLGNMYMDSVGYSTTNNIIISPYDPTTDHWFSVRAYSAANAKGRRSNAIYQPSGTSNCPITIDASASQLIAPSGALQNCVDLTNQVISVNIQNSGINSITAIPVSYSVNNGPVVSEIVAATINSLASAQYNFTATYDFSAVGNYVIKVWTDYALDVNQYNDTVQQTIVVTQGVLNTLPYSENFETFNICPTTNDCEQTQCALLNGWINQINLQDDDIDWRTSEGSTPSVGTGPDADHNPGTITGNYLYLEASVCFNRQGIVVSPCFDLTTSTLPQLQFWYHMYGAAMGELHVDVLYNDVWQNDVIPVISGDQGNNWLQATVNLSPFAGSIINIRFRGITGPDFTSDMAIDDINVFEVNAAPVTNFNASATSICSGGIITLNDLSQNLPTGWLWSITPATGFTFVNGTSATSQNPQVQFNVAGVYDINLTATNSFGSTSVNLPAYIQVDLASAIPLVETFQNPLFPPLNWIIENPDGAITWTASQNITGSAGTNTIASFIDNFNYNAAGQEDGMLTERIDLTNALNPAMTFDVSHARYSAAFEDALRIDVSTDCGLTFVPTSYFKQGVNLATTIDNLALFVPTQAAEWRNDTLPLALYAGQNVILKFVGITGYGNSLYIDNINFTEIPLSVFELNLLDGINVYPNPTHGLFTLNYRSKISDNILLKVTDAKGAGVYEKNTTVKQGNNNIAVDITGFDRGIYFLEIKSGDTFKTIKLVLT